MLPPMRMATRPAIAQRCAAAASSVAGFIPPPLLREVRVCVCEYRQGWLDVLYEVSPLLDACAAAASATAEAKPASRRCRMTTDRFAGDAAAPLKTALKRRQERACLSQSQRTRQLFDRWRCRGHIVSLYKSPGQCTETDSRTTLDHLWYCMPGTFGEYGPDNRKRLQTSHC